MARKKYFQGSIGPLYYEDTKLLPDGSGNFQSGIDADDGRIGVLVSITVVLQVLDLDDDACILLGTGDDICLKYDSGTNEYQIEDSANVDLLTVNEASGLVTVKNALQVDGALTLGTQLAVAEGGTGATTLDDIVGTANQINVAAGANTVIGGDATLTLSSTLDLPGTLDVTGAAVLDSTLLCSGDITIADAVDIILNATTGTKIGTAASQKLGFFNQTPVSQLLKASYNNWAAFGDVVQALVDIGLFDQT